ncbi:MAG: amidohydrolase [Phycisphaerales bacterium]|nr:amidohydrolase [Phycisphaerales bacterium]
MTTTTDSTTLNEQISAVYDELVAIRRDLHAHPELKFKESRTSQVVQKVLTDLGIEFVANIGGKEPNTGTGVVAHIPATTDQPGECIGLRADMDALPITEMSDLPHKSTIEGVMHACGHDGHTAILIGAAKVLSAMEHRPNPVTLVFQPAEEGGAGADKLIRDGALDGIVGPPIQRMYGLHGWPAETVGHISTRPGAMLAATDMFTVTIKGTQAHAAYPHLGVDPIVAASHIVTAAQSIVSRSTKPTDSVVLSITTIHSGTAFNVIPTAAIMQGTIRTLSDESRSSTKAKFAQIAESVAQGLGCSASIEWIPGYPVTKNDPHEAERVLEIARSVGICSESAIVEEPTLGGEDFSFYAQKVPSCFFFMGLAHDEQTPFPGLHTPSFDFNDQSIPLGVEMMCRLALS